MDELSKALFKKAIGQVPYPYQERLFDFKGPLGITNKSRRTGISTILAYKALVYALAGRTALILSPSLRQSRMLMVDYVERFLRAPVPGGWPGLKEDTKTEKRFEGDGTIVSLPNQSATIRGYSPDIVFMDEVAHFLNGTDKEVYESVLAMMTRGGQLLLSSTPFGDQNLFFQIWKGDNQFEKFTINWRDCPDLAARIELVRREYDELTFDQEFQNTFRGEVASEFPMRLIESCVDPEIDYEVNAHGDSAGFDVGRRRDLSCIAIIRNEGDTKRIVEKHTWAGVPFEEQQNRALEIAKRVGIFYIDQGGMGEAPSEWLRTRSENVVPVLFNDQLKTDMFLQLKRRFEQKKIVMPLDVRLMQSLNLIRRYYRLGRVIIDAERTDELGHADEATALALACWEPSKDDGFGALFF